MSIVTKTALLSDLLELFAQDPIALSLRKFGANPRAMIIAHVAAGQSWQAWDRKGKPIAAGGLIPTGDRVYEAWFVCSPRAAKSLAGILRHAQLTFALMAEDGPVKIRARVGRNWLPGQRIARLLGMAKTGREGGMDVWERYLG